MLIEQAIFTSTRTERGEGYQLVAQSPGLVDEDAQALRMWSPSHDALLPQAAGGRSLNFFRLPSGSYCVSRTTRAGAEFSGRGEAVFSHLLIAPPEVLERFSNNPFALVRAAEAGGALKTEHDGARHLAAFALVGRASAVHLSLLAELTAELGAARLVLVVDAALAAPQLGIIGGPSAERLIEALLNCLPVECRPEFSFSTGLKHSPRRPFRVLALDRDPQEQRRLEQHCGMRTVLLDAMPIDMPSSPWAQHVAECLASGPAQLAAQLTIPRPGLGLAELANLAQDLTSKPRGPAGGERLAVAHAHAAHHRFSGQAEQGAVANGKLLPSGSAPSIGLATDLPLVVAKLEILDDAVYDAIAGKSGALADLVRLWPQVLMELGPEVVEESREQYLTYALRIWDQFGGEPDPPQKAIAALDVLSVLLQGRQE